MPYPERPCSSMGFQIERAQPTASHLHNPQLVTCNPGLRPLNQHMHSPCVPYAIYIFNRQPRDVYTFAPGPQTSYGPLAPYNKTSPPQGTISLDPAHRPSCQLRHWLQERPASGCPGLHLVSYACTAVSRGHQHIQRTGCDVGAQTSRRESTHPPR